MSEKYKTTFRGYLIDNHSPDPPAVTLEKLNPEEFERFFLEADLNECMIYCKDHWGNSYYDTKIGKIHGGLKQDWIRQLIPVLKKHDIEFTAYYCFEYDSYAPKAHPEWSVVEKDGTPLVCGSGLNSTRAHWGIPCYETGYRQYILGQLKEIVEGYHPDSLFIDIFGKSLCYCPSCRKQFKRKYGYELPETDEGLLEHNKDLVAFLDGQAEDMLDEMKAQLKSIDPDLAISVNFASHYPKSLRDKLDYIFTEPWAGNWLSGAYARDTSNGRHPKLGPGDVSAVYNYRPDTIYELAAAEIAAQDCRVFMYSEPMHYDGTLEFEEAAKIGKAYRKVEQFEHLLGNRKVMADIAIVQSDTADSLIVRHPIIARSIARAKEGGMHRKALLGAMKLCDASQYTWQVVPEFELDYEKMKQYKMIILPNLFYVREEFQEDLKRYVEEGGCIFLAGETGLYNGDGQMLDEFALSELMGFGFAGKNEEYRGNDWAAFVEQTEDSIWKYCEKTTPPVLNYILETKDAKAKVLGTFLNPAVRVTPTTWVNWGCPPPGKPNGLNAIYENSYGKGTVLTCCFDFFSMEDEDYNWTDPFFRGAASKYIAPQIYLETPNRKILEYTCYDRASEKKLIFHELSAMARLSGGSTPVIPGGSLKLNLEGKQVAKICMAFPEKKELEIKKNGDTLTVELPDITVHNVFEIFYED